jgi:hypothetical protein
VDENDEAVDREARMNSPEQSDIEALFAALHARRRDG